MIQVKQSRTQASVSGGVKIALASLALAAGASLAQAAPHHHNHPHAPNPSPPTTKAPEVAAPAAPVATEGAQLLRLFASLGGSDLQPLRSGVVWRVFEEAAQPDGSHKLVAQSEDSLATVALPDGSYVVHAAFGLAGVTRRVVIDGKPATERLQLNAGGLKLIDKLGDAQIPPQRLAISIYVPERGNSEAKLVLANAKAADIIGLPEGSYHVVSTLLDTAQGAQGGANITNSMVTADLKVPAGKLIEATLRHHAATMTLKLVKQPGGEALANTNFSVLTPGGDVIRELIGAFPSMVLAEGEYVAIARYEGKTYQHTFRVQSAKDADVEIVARENGSATEAEAAPRPK